MNKKERMKLDKQLDKIVDELLSDGLCSTNAIVEGLYARMLFKLRDKIDELVKGYERKKMREVFATDAWIIWA